MNPKITENYPEPEKGENNYADYAVLFHENLVENQAMVGDLVSNLFQSIVGDKYLTYEAKKEQSEPSWNFDLFFGGEKNHLKMMIKRSQRT